MKCATLSISLTITESQGTERKDSLTSLKIRFIDTHTLRINNIVLNCIEKTYYASRFVQGIITLIKIKQIHSLKTSNSFQGKIIVHDQYFCSRG